MSQFLLFPVFFPFLAGPFAYWIGCWYEKARNTFVMSAAALELFLVLTLWTKPELAQATAAVEGFCGLGIQLRAGGFHTLMALLTATGWMAATVFCREYMAHVHKQNRFYLFWLMTLGATMGVFLSGDLFTAFLFFEIMSFTSFVLVVQTEEYPALKAGETYLAVAVIGGLAALTGLFLLYHQLGTLSLDAMAAAARRSGGPGTALGGRPAGAGGIRAPRRGRSRCTSGCPPPIQRRLLRPRQCCPASSPRRGYTGCWCCPQLSFSMTSSGGCCWRCWVL